MTTYRFQPIATTRTYTGVCEVCGKRVTRRKRFEHTVNPYSRNEDGTVRTADEVYECVKSEADAYEPDFTHAKCVVGTETENEQ